MKKIIGTTLICIGLLFSACQSGDEASESMLYSLSKTEPQETRAEESFEEDSPTDQKMKRKDLLEDEALEPAVEEVFTARMNLDQSGRKFIRTLESRFRVLDVRQATQKIEDICLASQGFIIHSELRSQVNRIQEDYLDMDSLQKTTFYQMESQIRLRVPSHRLDSLLRALNPIVAFMDYRILKAEDMSWELLAKDKYRRRQAEAELRIKNVSNNASGDLNDRVNAEDYLLRQQHQADAAEIEEKVILDKVAYSDLHLLIYQNEVPMVEKVARFQVEKPSLSSRIGQALYNSLGALENILVGLFEIWYLWVLGIGLYMGYRYIRKK